MVVGWSMLTRWKRFAMRPCLLRRFLIVMIQIAIVRIGMVRKNCWKVMRSMLESCCCVWLVMLVLGCEGVGNRSWPYVLGVVRWGIPGSVVVVVALGIGIVALEYYLAVSCLE